MSKKKHPPRVKKYRDLKQRAMGRNIEDIKHFLLMPIECTTETNRVFVYKGRIYSSQMYRGMDPDMSDLAIRFYKIIYGRDILAGTKLLNDQFCGDTVNSLYSAKTYGIKGEGLKKWDRNNRCLANFWLLPMPIGHTSPTMNYEIRDMKYGYKDLIKYSKSNSKIRDNMYSFLRELEKKDFEDKFCEFFPEYWGYFGKNFKIKHFLGNIYDSMPDVINYEDAFRNICSRAEIIAEEKQNELSDLMDSIENLNL